MGVNRRDFLVATSSLISSNMIGPPFASIESTREIQVSRRPPSFAVVPVVGDGKWIWREPPKDGTTGYLEPREFEVTVGIHMRGQGPATSIQASTVAPVAFPEQEIVDVQLELNGCQGMLQAVDDSAAQLLMASSSIRSGQEINAIARYRMKLMKDYRGFRREQFAAEQPASGPTRQSTFAKRFLLSSPGINIRGKLVKKLIRELGSSVAHPWDRAKLFYDWVWDNIEGIPGEYTSVESAIKNRRGDCEERATVFIALCRAAGIPARLVWVPSHNWAEIGLYDLEGNPHWIPIHTAAYSWFGWTGAHEVVLQKGDQISLPNRSKKMRLIDDWYRVKGRKPEIRFTSTVTPIAAEGKDAGPGAREKLKDGRWRLAGNHPDNSIMRDQ